MQAICADLAIQKSGTKAEQLDLLFAGDLENQCTASNYTLRNLDVPFAGLYNACATMAEGAWRWQAALSRGDSRSERWALTSSHFCAAERQFRFPLEYGGKRTPTSQWTATASGGVVLGDVGGPPYVRAVTFGRVIDYGIRDINNMGAAMAPAAVSTLLTFFKDSGEKPEDFNRIFTGRPRDGGLGTDGGTLQAGGGPAQQPRGLRPAALRPRQTGGRRGWVRRRLQRRGALQPHPAPGCGRASCGGCSSSRPAR